MRPLRRALLQLRARPVPIFRDPAYRLPLSELEPRSGHDPRRADLALWALVHLGAVKRGAVRRPRRARYAELARVHEPAYLESLSRPETLARIFAVDPWDLPVDELLRSLRLAVGGTVEAARLALRRRGPVLNLLGGFHHAFPGKGGGFCALNDVAVAVAALRSEGFRGRVAVLDLDAHPPDGTAACLERDPASWIGSISGVDWGPLPGVEERVLPRGAGDAPYLAALDELLGLVPRAELAFVLAGGDVLAGDRLGRLGLSLEGARERDRRVAEALDGRASVWLPAGGYGAEAWRLLAGTALVLAGLPRLRLPRQLDPLRARYGAVARELDPGALSSSGSGDALLEPEDIEEALGIRRPPPRRLLGYYTAEGLEYALCRYGLLEHLRRLGYREPRVVVDRASAGDRMRLFAQADGQEHLLFEAVLERRTLGELPVLYVHWLTLRHPRGRWSPERPRLPGQEVPGLGLAREAGQMLLRMARRLELAGVAFRPSYYHVAYSVRAQFRFLEARVQGRFEALLDALAGIALLEATRAVHGGRVEELRDGSWAVAEWEPADMAFLPEWSEDWRREVSRWRAATRFRLREGPQPGEEPPAGEAPPPGGSGGSGSTSA